MGKEVKIGLAAIGVLLCVFGGVLFFRLRREAPDTSQKHVAAVKKERKASSKKKEPGGSENRIEDRYGRLGGKTDWSTQSNADSVAESREVDQERAPALEASPYRDRSAVARRGRHAEVPPAENLSDDIGTEETGQDDAQREQTQDAGDLSMPLGRPTRRPGDPFPRDAFAEDAPSEENRADQSQPADDGDEDAAEVPATEDEQLAMDRAADRSQGGQGMIENDLDQPAESENEAVQLSPLVEDESEVRPAANDRYAKGRYDQSDRNRFDRNQSDRGRLDRGQVDGRQFDGDDADRDRGVALQEQEMVDDADSVGDDPVEEGPGQPRPEGDSYVVQPNDNFWRISQKVYGTGAYFKALEEHNRRQHGEKRLVNVGDVLSVPPLMVLRENYADLCPKPRHAPAERETLLTSSPVRGARGSRTYTVAEGDTLFDIARHELGKASRWAEIYQLNREQLGEDFNYLSPGMRLLLPERGKQADPIASRPPRDGYRR